MFESHTFGAYQLVRVVSVSAMSEVYVATHKPLEGFARTVVLKRLIASALHDTAMRGMFVQEASVCASLQHPGVVSLLDCGDVDGWPYFTMEYIEGCSLAELMATHKTLSCEAVAWIGKCVAEVLQQAHQQGIVHRDVHPGNILVSNQGVVKLADFGVAKNTHAFSRTHEGLLKGTVAYMAPEYLRDGVVHPSVDQYALGYTLQQCLADRTDGLWDVCARMCAWEVSSRYVSMQDASDACSNHVLNASASSHVLALYVQQVVQKNTCVHPRTRVAALAPHTSRAWMQVCVVCVCVLYSRGLKDTVFSAPHQKGVSCVHEKKHEGYGTVSVRLLRGWAKVYNSEGVYLTDTPMMHVRLPVGRHTFFLKKPGAVVHTMVSVEVVKNTHVLKTLQGVSTDGG